MITKHGVWNTPPQLQPLIRYRTSGQKTELNRDVLDDQPVFAIGLTIATSQRFCLDSVSLRCCRYYHSVVAQVMRIARATFGQEPMVTEIQVIAGDMGG
jgi:hypothetical protein